MSANQNNDPNKQLESFDDINRKDRISLISKVEMDEQNKDEINYADQLVNNVKNLQ